MNLQKKKIKCSRRRRRKSPKCEDGSGKCVWDGKKRCIPVKTFRKNKKREQYIKRLNFNIKRNTDKTYNAQAVAKALGIKSDLSYTKQCIKIMNFLEGKKNSNPVVKELLSKKLKNHEICNILVDVLYNLLQPEKFPFKAPITISPKKYNDLIKKYKKRKLTSKSRQTLNEALNIKYCFCLKKLYLKFLFNEHIKGEKNKYTEYGICMNSIYKSRKIAPPQKVARKCKIKYNWYKNS